MNRKQILTILRQHEAALKQYSVKRIGLFGSYARGDERHASDIDFLVEFRKPTFDNFMGLVDYLEKLFGTNVDLLTPDGVDSIRVQSVKEGIRKSMPERRDLEWVADIGEAIRRIDAYVADMSYADFLDDTKTQDALVRNLEIIGEAVKNISPEFKKKNKTIDWTAMPGCATSSYTITSV